MQIIFAELTPEYKIENDALMKLLPDERRAELARFKFVIDSKLSMYAELLVRYQACRILELNNEDIVFEKGENGKPYIQNNPKFQFNISHTRNAIAVAFSDGEIGVDIERLSSADFKIAKRFFAPCEQDYIFSSEYPERAFYEVWTKKEAYIKYIGDGLTIPLPSFDVLDVKTTAIFRTVEVGDYIMSVCYKELIMEEPYIINITERELQILFSEIQTV